MLIINELSDIIKWGFEKLNLNKELKLLRNDLSKGILKQVVSKNL